MLSSKIKVAVTGITGHLGFVLVQRLLEKGYNVRVVVRDLKRTKEMPWISDLKVELAQADMTDQPAMENALKGVDGLFHVAAVFDVTSDHPESDVIQKNIQGTERTLLAAAANGIKKIVYTSSVAAVGTSAAPVQVKDESNWNDETKEPYALSKVLSERKAWEIAKQHHLNLIAILPGTILGPQFHKINPSLGLVETGIKGEFPMVPPVNFNFVDIRDAADAHIRAFENERASGRYILSNQTLTVLGLLKEMNKIDSKIRVPKREMPKWFIKIFPVMDSIQHAITRSPRKMTSGFVKEYVGRFHVLSSERAKKDLGWAPRPLESTLKDTIQWFVNWKDQHKY